jgi:hypothetical protein
VGSGMTEIAQMMRSPDPVFNTRDALSRALKDEVKSACIVRAVKSLFKSPYWSRLWILQELAVSTKTHLICGGGEINWRKFLEVATWIAALDKHQTSVIEMQSLVVRYQPVWLLSLAYQDPRWGDRLDLAKLVYMSKHALATDERDHVRALLGLVGSGPETLPASIDGDDSGNWSACAIICHAIRQMFDDMKTTKNHQNNPDSKPNRKWSNKTIKDCRKRAGLCQHAPLDASAEAWKGRMECKGVACGGLATCRIIATILYERGTMFAGKITKSGPKVRYALNGLWQRDIKGWELDELEQKL